MTTISVARPMADRPLRSLVIFDCDGVLVDSEPISLGMLTRALNRIGVPIDQDTVRARFAGTAMASIMEHIARDYGVTAPDEFVATTKSDTLKAFDSELRPITDVAAAIGALAIPYCVASSSDPVRLRHALTLTGLLPLFEGRLFSSTMVERGKPFPDLFLHAAQAMGAPPSACLVIEDSVPGVAAAKAAGMQVVGFVGGGHWGHDPDGTDLVAAGAARVFRTFRDFPQILAGWRSVGL